MNRSSGWKLAFSRWRDLSDAPLRAHWLQALKDCLTRAGHILASDEDLFYAFYGDLFRPIAMAIAGDVGRLETYNTVMGSSAAMPCRRHRRPCPMVRESYHEAAACPDAEGQPPAAAAEVALHSDAGPGGRAGHEPQAMVLEHQRAHPCKSAGRTCEPEKSPAMASMTRGSVLAPESPPCGRTQPQNRKPA